MAYNFLRSLRFFLGKYKRTLLTIFLPRLYANFLKEVLKFKFDEMRGAAECFVWDIVSPQHQNFLMKWSGPRPCQ